MKNDGFLVVRGVVRCLQAWVVGLLLPCSAAAQVELDLHAYAGITITGETGRVYAVEYSLSSSKAMINA